MTGPGIEKAILAGAHEMGQSLPCGSAAKLETLIDELARWGRRVNLTAIRDPLEMVSGHILDSLAVRPFIEGHSVIDVGTGAGFPGLPLAICEPDLEVTLLDSNGKKIAFVQHMIGKLGLQNARAIKARSEDFAPDERFDTVVARALAPIPRIIELAGHLLAGHGMLLALKGKYPAEELEVIVKQPDAWETRVSELTIPGLARHSRHVVRLRRKTERLL